MIAEMAHFTDEEEAAVSRIIKRAVKLYADFGIKRAPIDVRMDISAVHAGTPLRLYDLAEAEDGDFGHDIGGIGKYLDRSTGRLTDGFLPRYAN